MSSAVARPSGQPVAPPQHRDLPATLKPLGATHPAGAPKNQPPAARRHAFWQRDGWWRGTKPAHLGGRLAMATGTVTFSQATCRCRWGHPSPLALGVPTPNRSGRFPPAPPRARPCRMAALLPPPSLPLPQKPPRCPPSGVQPPIPGLCRPRAGTASSDVGHPLSTPALGGLGSSPPNPQIPQPHRTPARGSQPHGHPGTGVPSPTAPPHRWGTPKQGPPMTKGTRGDTLVALGGRQGLSCPVPTTGGVTPVPVRAAPRDARPGICGHCGSSLLAAPGRPNPLSAPGLWRWPHVTGTAATRLGHPSPATASPPQWAGRWRGVYLLNPPSAAAVGTRAARPPGLPPPRGD